MQEPIRLKPQCISCLVKSKLDQYPKDVSDEKKVEYMQRVLREIAELKLHECAPVASRVIYNIQKDMFGYAKDYSQIKRHFNQLLMNKIPMLRRELSEVEEPLKLGIQYAMTGNYIDFGAMNTVDETQLEAFLSESSNIKIDEDEYSAIKRDITDATRIVYLLDNCGEIVLDKLLLEIIKNLNPNAQITAVVRGGDIFNDVTLEDAKQVGLENVAEVIHNGSDIAGTFLDVISQEAKEIINAADVIIAKGQGNFETLQKCGMNIYYIFMCKCEMFADRFDVPKYTGILVNDHNL